MKMPFGKYKDEEIDDVPIAYLDWLVDQGWVDPVLLLNIENHLDKQSDYRAMRDRGQN